MRNLIETELKPFSDEWSDAGQVPKSVYKSWGERGLLTALYVL